MKKALLALSALLLVITAFTTAPDQKFKVENTLDKWQSKLNLIEYTKQVLKGSDVPAKVAIPLTDSLTVFENEIIEQVKTQVPKDTTNKK